jgi:hypothetical protein
VNSIVERARQYEERGQFIEALSQFDILRNIYAQYPGIEFETERLKRRRDGQIREESKGRWVEQVDRQIGQGDYARARELARTALDEFPGDRELTELERMAETALGHAAEAEEWLQRGQKLCFDRQFGEGLEALRKAASLDNRNAVIRATLLNALVEHARSVLGHDWRAAEPLIEQALNIDAGHPLAKSLQALVLDYKRQEILNECVSQAREMQANGDLSGALAKVEEVLASCPSEVRLVQLRTTLRNLGRCPPPRLRRRGDRMRQPLPLNWDRNSQHPFRRQRTSRRLPRVLLTSIEVWPARSQRRRQSSCRSRRRANAGPEPGNWSRPSRSDSAACRFYYRTGPNPKEDCPNYSGH